MNEQTTNTEYEDDDKEEGFEDYDLTDPADLAE